MSHLQEKNPLLLKKLLENIKYLNFDHNEEEDIYITCAKSGIDLMSIVDGNRKVHESHGQCSTCGFHFAIEHLHTNSESNSEWPIVYKGYHCKECYNSAGEG